MLVISFAVVGDRKLDFCFSYRVLSFYAKMNPASKLGAPLGLKTLASLM